MCIYGETNCGNGHQKKNKPRDWKHFLSKMKYLKQRNKHEESVSQILFFEIIVSSYIALFRGQNSDDHYIYYCEQEYLRRNGIAITESEMQYLGAISKTTEWSLFVSKGNHSVSQ